MGWVSVHISSKGQFMLTCMAGRGAYLLGLLYKVLFWNSALIDKVFENDCSGRDGSHACVHKLQSQCTQSLNALNNRGLRASLSKTLMRRALEANMQ